MKLLALKRFHGNLIFNEIYYRDLVSLSLDRIYLKVLEGFYDPMLFRSEIFIRKSIVFIQFV